MDAVKGFTMTVCFAAVASSMLELIAPNGKMEKMIKFVLGAFMLAAIINPIKDIALEIGPGLKNSHLEKYKESDLENAVDKQIKDNATESIKKLIYEVLDKINVKPEKIDIFMDTNEKNSISIIKTKIYLSNKNSDRHDEVKKLIEKELELETEVIVLKER